MASLRELILERLVVVAAAAGAAAGAGAYRSRKVGVAKALAPAIIISPVSETAVRFSQANDRRDLTVQIDVLARGDPWDQLADAVATPLFAAVNTDAQLLSMTVHIHNTESNWTDEEADRTAGVLSQHFVFTYLCSDADIGVGPVS